MLVAIVVPFSLTYIVGKKKLSDLETEGKKVSEEVTFVSPFQGKMLSLNEVDDKVFSEGLMGDGFAVELSDGKVVAPFDGKVIMTFPTKHAYGLRRNDGVEILLHIGMDTVELKGEGFESYVELDQEISSGDVICKVDLDLVKVNHKSLVSPVVFTSGQKITLCKKDQNIKILEKDIINIDN